MSLPLTFVVSSLLLGDLDDFGFCFPPVVNGLKFQDSCKIDQIDQCVVNIDIMADHQDHLSCKQTFISLLLVWVVFTSVFYTRKSKSKQ